jgi:hypothetical protein
MKRTALTRIAAFLTVSTLLSIASGVFTTPATAQEGLIQELERSFTNDYLVEDVKDVVSHVCGIEYQKVVINRNLQTGLLSCTVQGSKKFTKEDLKKAIDEYIQQKGYKIKILSIVILSDKRNMLVTFEFCFDNGEQDMGEFDF